MTATLLAWCMRPNSSSSSCADACTLANRVSASQYLSIVFNSWAQYERCPQRKWITQAVQRTIFLKVDKSRRKMECTSIAQESRISWRSQSSFFLVSTAQRLSMTISWGTVSSLRSSLSACTSTFAWSDVTCYSVRATTKVHDTAKDIRWRRYYRPLAYHIGQHGEDVMGRY